ncbi:hypothetical protein CDEST_06914 [Colletotrichum destructivum]|uniref:Uncharacterized protein n=1 Tax=Colletotrichum destructivum TaxID=34406 RepID=A0AAX4IFP8_9PEZI|nr:hypothetical protein CDEST_06914 [Colletotrichum destructivum]
MAHVAPTPTSWLVLEARHQLGPQTCYLSSKVIERKVRELAWAIYVARDGLEGSFGIMSAVANSPFASKRPEVRESKHYGLRQGDQRLLVPATEPEIFASGKLGIQTGYLLSRWRSGGPTYPAPCSGPPPSLVLPAGRHFGRVLAVPQPPRDHGRTNPIRRTRLKKTCVCQCATEPCPRRASETRCRRQTGFGVS